MPTACKTSLRSSQQPSRRQALAGPGRPMWACPAMCCWSASLHLQRCQGLSQDFPSALSAALWSSCSKRACLSSQVSEGPACGPRSVKGLPMPPCMWNVPLHQYSCLICRCIFHLLLRNDCPWPPLIIPSHFSGSILRPLPQATSVATATTLLRAAERPLLVVGKGAAMSPGAEDEVSCDCVTVYDFPCDKVRTPCAHGTRALGLWQHPHAFQDASYGMYSPVPQTVAPYS